MFMNSAKQFLAAVLKIPSSPPKHTSADEFKKALLLEANKKAAFTQSMR